MLFRGHAVEGRLILPPEATAWLSRYHDEPIRVELEAVHARRSVPQNRRLWLGYSRALKQAASLMPYSKDELHDALKHRSEVLQDAMLYLPNGEQLGVARSTKRLPMPRFSDYMEEVSATFARGGIDIYADDEP
jgi:hypothetical protein